MVMTLMTVRASTTFILSTKKTPTTHTFKQHAAKIQFIQQYSILMPVQKCAQHIVMFILWLSTLVIVCLKVFSPRVDHTCDHRYADVRLCHLWPKSRLLCTKLHWPDLAVLIHRPLTGKAPSTVLWYTPCGPVLSTASDMVRPIVVSWRYRPIPLPPHSVHIIKYRSSGFCSCRPDNVRQTHCGGHICAMRSAPQHSDDRWSQVLFFGLLRHWGFRR